MRIDMLLREVSRNSERIAELRAALTPPTPSPTVYWIMAMPPAWVCIALAEPNHTFAMGAGYLVMAELADELTWSFFSGAVFFLGALCAAIRRPAARTIGIGIVGFWHAVVACCVFAAAPTSIATPAYVAVAALCAVLYWRS